MLRLLPPMGTQGARESSCRVFPQSPGRPRCTSWLSPPSKKSDTKRRTLIRSTSEGRPGGGGLFTSTHFIADVQELAQGLQSFSPESGRLKTGDVSPRPLSLQRAQGQYCSCHEGLQIRQTRRERKR